MGPDGGFDARLDPGVLEFAAVLRSALGKAGGFEFVMRSEDDPGLRTAEVEPLLDELGVFDLDPGLGEEHVQAAATACRVAGSYALPYPVAERLAATTLRGRADLPRALGVVAAPERPGPHRVPVNMGDLALDWRVVDVSGRLSAAERGIAAAGRLGPFVAELTVTGPGQSAPPDLLALALNLQNFSLLGMLESAFELTVSHARQRAQFGSPIVSYQAVQQQLANALIVVELFEQQALYALWSGTRERAGLLVDVLGARATGLRAAEVVLRAGHQVHGASGFCDETPVSWISRHSQPLRRLPVNRPETESWFTRLVQRDGFDGIFTPAGASTDASRSVSAPVFQSAEATS